MKNQSLIEDEKIRRNNRVSLENLRILLWDIDGTLMRSKVQGSYKKYFAATMTEIFGSAGSLEKIIPSGMTDTQIMYEALRDEGFTPERIFAEKEKLLKIFREEMSRFVAANADGYIVLEGVREILAKTDGNLLFINSLLTGNLSVAAEIKLKTVGLWHYFAGSINAFGEISHDRRDLALEAGRLFREFYRFDFRPEQFVVIGDTPNDIAAARASGAKCLAVATGKNHPREELSAYQPDVIVDDLADTRTIFEILQTI